MQLKLMGFLQECSHKPKKVQEIHFLRTMDICIEVCDSLSNISLKAKYVNITLALEETQVHH